MKAHSLITL